MSQTNPIPRKSLPCGFSLPALGLGTCWINRAREEFDTPEWQAWLRSLGIEGDYEGIGHLSVGYPDGEPRPAKPRKPCVYKV